MYLSNMLKWFNSSASPGKENWTCGIHGEKEFKRVLERERARAERSFHRFSLVVFETGEGNWDGREENLLLAELSIRMRATDEAGRFEGNRIGVILYNATAESAWSFAEKIRKSLFAEGLHLRCKVYSYPPPKGKSIVNDLTASLTKVAKAGAEQQFNYDCPMEELQQFYAKKMPLQKRCLDLICSLLGLIILSPLFILLSCLIKTVSPGPAFYRQTRIGLGGRPFTLLKFRTMKVNADNTEHRKHLASLIQGGKDHQDCSQAMVKLDDNNCNIIYFGKLIRKTYLDELPQLINVLLGDMSLIGPRPPIPYEVSEYQLWHKDRFDTTPGMTGLWQVSGKNKLSFEQMVRLDINYSRKQSFLMDFKILLKTPIVIATELKGSLYKMGQLIKVNAGNVNS